MTVRQVFHQATVRRGRRTVADPTPAWIIEVSDEVT
jgi:hypothetical protein